MMEIVKPKITEIVGTPDSQASYVVEPLERGYGTTIGNCLRRILCTALPGAAIIGIQIEGVKHEFSTVPGVKEDVAEIILNLKEVAVKVHTAAYEADRFSVVSDRNEGAVSVFSIHIRKEYVKGFLFKWIRSVFCAPHGVGAFICYPVLYCVKIVAWYVWSQSHGNTPFLIHNL